MKDVLARAKELVNELSELLNKEEKKGDTELSELAAGEEFYTEIGEFIVLEQLEGITKVITKDLYLKYKAKVQKIFFLLEQKKAEVIRYQYNSKK